MVTASVVWNSSPPVVVAAREPSGTTAPTVPVNVAVTMECVASSRSLPSRAPKVVQLQARGVGRRLPVGQPHHNLLQLRKAQRHDPGQLALRRLRVKRQVNAQRSAQALVEQVAVAAEAAYRDAGVGDGGHQAALLMVVSP